MKKSLFKFILDEFFSLFNLIFFGILLMFTIVKFTKIYEITGFNLPFKHFLFLIFLSIPDTTLVILPLSFLLSLTITITKLSSTHEIIAFECSGIAPNRFLKFFFVIAIILTLFTHTLSLLVKPYCNFIIRKNIEKLIQSKIIVLPRPGEFRKIFENTYLYVDNLGSNLEGIIFFQPKNGIEIQMISAKSGTIQKKHDYNVFNLNNGSFIKIESDKISLLKFNKMIFSPFSVTEKKDEYDLNRGSLPTSILIKKLLEKNITHPQKTELFYRIFLPFSNIIFLLFGFPLSWRYSKSYKTTGIIISIVVSLAYYIIFSTINALSTKGIINPFYAFFLATIILFLAGIAYIRKKFKRLL
jgi:lipopolysaccharide export system permease protein